MRHVKLVALTVLFAVTAVPVASANGDLLRPTVDPCSVESTRQSPWSVSFGVTPPAAAPTRLRLSDVQTMPARRPVPIEYSDGYKVRAKIHKIASFATLPLFIANYVVGQDLYNNPGRSESKKGLHGGLAATTGVLFGINTVTGVWNMWEGRKDPNHKARRMAHGILMLAADAGFLATGMMAPEHEGPSQNYGDRGSTHRSVAITSMGIATAGYLMMLVWR